MSRQDNTLFERELRQARRHSRNYKCVWSRAGGAVLRRIEMADAGAKTLNAQRLNS
ncbi:MAG: hypothetical protein J2P52_00300 [Blastocatellia bacterium]|nr:hypothetical protein [Blastocatellia bacterium]